MTNPNINIKFVFNNRDSPIKLSHIVCPKLLVTSVNIYIE